METDGSWAERRADLRGRMREGLKAKGFDLRPKGLAVHPRWPLVTVWWGLGTCRYHDGAIQEVHLWARIGYAGERLPQRWSGDPSLSSRYLDREGEWQTFFERIGREAVKKQRWAEEQATDKAQRDALRQVVEWAEKRVKTRSRIDTWGNEITVMVYLPHEEAALVKALRSLKRLGVLREASA